MNDKWINNGQYPKKALTACNDTLNKVGKAIFLETEPYPYRWARNHGWEAFRYVYRKELDLTREGATGHFVFRNGLTCPEVW
ncbi:MAG: hypothetical protein JJE35_07410 [Thermoleophilia bacterium]|nr:hypothetical protein [Thermoleophilia bacterium]